MTIWMLIMIGWLAVALIMLVLRIEQIRAVLLALPVLEMTSPTSTAKRTHHARNDASRVSRRSTNAFFPNPPTTHVPEPSTC